jgi:hypothetical protein
MAFPTIGGFARGEAACCAPTSSFRFALVVRGVGGRPFPLRLFLFRVGLLCPVFLGGLFLTTLVPDHALPWLIRCTLGDVVLKA